MAHFYRSWDHILVLAGPLSWPAAAVGVLVMSLLIRGPWVELTAMVYAFTLLVWLHGLLTGILVGQVALRCCRGLSLGGWLPWGLVYYLGLPLLMLGILEMTVGPRGTTAVLRYIWHFPRLLGR